MFGQTKRAEQLAQIELLKYYHDTLFCSEVTMVEDLVELWKLFIRLPLQTKQIIKYQPDARISGVGYEYKDGTDGRDHKEDIHLQLAAGDMLRQLAKETGAPVAMELVDLGLAILESMPKRVNAYLAEMESRVGLKGFQAESLVVHRFWLLRLLHYFPGVIAPCDIAAPHPDKGDFASILYESHPGLQFYTADGKWEDVKLDRGDLIVIPGLGLQHRSECKITAAYHRVVATRETAAEGRYSAVCFSDSQYSFAYNKEKHKSTQGLPLAFNYGLTPEEFDEYFIRAV